MQRGGALLQCPTCNQTNDEDAKFCYACGTRLVAAAPAPGVQPGPAEPGPTAPQPAAPQPVTPVAPPPPPGGPVYPGAPGAHGYSGAPVYGPAPRQPFPVLAVVGGVFALVLLVLGAWYFMSNRQPVGGYAGGGGGVAPSGGGGGSVTPSGGGGNIGGGGGGGGESNPEDLTPQERALAILQLWLSLTEDGAYHDACSVSRVATNDCLEGAEAIGEFLSQGGEYTVGGATEYQTTDQGNPIFIVYTTFSRSGESLDINFYIALEDLPIMGWEQG